MKKVLVIVYYWPPAGGPGVQRWLKFVKYLPEFGFEPIVFIPENPSYPIIDESLLAEVPKNVTIIRKRIFEPYTIASLFSNKKINKISSGIMPAPGKQSFFEKIAIWIRGNVFIPDARVLWVRPASAYLKRYISANNIDTIITSGPPHSLHLIGLKLKKQTDVKWIADFRDPWTTIGYHNALKLSSASHRKHEKLERKVLNSADTILVTSKSTKAEFAKITSQPIEIITNGYDIQKMDSPKLDNKFSIAHIGSLLSGRNPKILWESLSELVTELPDFKSHFELKLIGATSQEIIDSISNYNLMEFTNVIGYVSHPEAVIHQQQSQVLLLIEINSHETKSIIPGKLFEYMASGRPILAIGPNGSDFAEIIKETNTGVFVDYSDKQKLKDTISLYYSNFIKGMLNVESVGVDRYTRKNLTQKLADILKSQ